MQHIENSTVIVAPLDWGLGHASRCIPIIKTLLAHNNRCIIASSGRALALLRLEVPALEYEELPAYNIRYGRNTFSTFFKLLAQIPKALKIKQKEQNIANTLVQKYHANYIISDNRFGMYSPLCTSIFVTHQIRIRLPLLLQAFEYLFFMANKRMIAHFNECWIPDYEGSQNLSGILSHSWKIPNTYYIGMLSARERVNVSKNYDIVCILSGPEPQRGLFETALLEILPQLPYTSCVVQGIVSEEHTTTHTGNCEIRPFSTNKDINQLLCSAKIIVSRAGYSSLMDYEKLHLRAILVPTPGQSEQKYLSKYVGKNHRYFHISQRDLRKKLPVLLHKIVQ
ncbi:MAG: hypothetical protein LBU90_06995 [Bacteroidales bacterium]|jgi:predicted glycosyltransferase|nr:hypothetical protein [Bacteroidales bacterium]